MGEEAHRAAHPGVLRLYDVHLDAYRDATQRDLDRLVETANAYGKLRVAVAKVHGDLRENIGVISDG